MELYQYHDVNYRGTIEQVTYTTKNRAGQIRQKYANIYLPKGYDPENAEKKYNILYVMHGGGGNPDAWLDCCKVKNMLDYCIDAGTVEPLIVVFPTFYKEIIPRGKFPNGDAEREHVLFFQQELVEELLPAVEGRYRVYAASSSAEDLKAAREHRGFGGFSMGACTTWFAFQMHPEYFSRYVPLSGDSWALEARGGGIRPEETAKLLAETAVAAGLPFRIFAATGTRDIACGNLSPQIEAMKKYPEVFVFSDNCGEGNIHYLLAEGMHHSYEDVSQYLYHFLPYLFA